MNTTAQIIFLIFALTSSSLASNSTKKNEASIPKFAQQLAHDFGKGYAKGFMKDYSHYILEFHDSELTYISCNVTGGYYKYFRYLKDIISKIKTAHMMISNVEYDDETGVLKFEYFQILDFKEQPRAVLQIGRASAKLFDIYFKIFHIEEGCPSTVAHIGEYKFVEKS